MEKRSEIKLKIINFFKPTKLKFLLFIGIFLVIPVQDHYYSGDPLRGTFGYRILPFGGLLLIASLINDFKQGFIISLPFEPIYTVSIYLWEFIFKISYMTVVSWIISSIATLFWKKVRNFLYS